MKSKGSEDRTRGEIEVREARRPEGDGEMSQNARWKKIKSRKKGREEKDGFSSET